MRLVVPCPSFQIRVLFGHIAKLFLCVGQLGISRFQLHFQSLDLIAEGHHVVGIFLLVLLKALEIRRSGYNSNHSIFTLHNQSMMNGKTQAVMVLALS